MVVSVGHNGLTGTRNAPTVLNAAFNKSQFWDGCEPDLEGQSKQPPINPVEGGLANHEPMLEIVRKAPDYPAAFQSVFGINSDKVTIDHICQLWTSPKLGSNGVACAQCHPNAANTHPETYPKFQKQIGKVIPLWEMITWCLMNPLER